MEEFVMYEIYTTAPTDGQRLEKEMRVYGVLEQLNIPFERGDHEEAMTMEACKAIDQALGITMCKNLFLCNRQKTNFYLLLMPGEKKFLTKDFSKQLGVSRLSFADGEFMEKYLDITPGSVSILGLMNDKEHHVHLSIDQELLQEEYLGCHPCINTSSLKIKTSDIMEKFLKYTGHEATIVEL